MPALPLTPSQTADANRLSAIFERWQAMRKKNGEPSSQEALAPLLGFGQSAFSQYKNGDIPLNVKVLVKLCSVFECAPSDISPELAAKIDDIAAVSGTTVRPVSVHPLPTVASKSSDWPFDRVSKEEYATLRDWQKEGVQDLVIEFIKETNRMLKRAGRTTVSNARKSSNGK